MSSVLIQPAPPSEKFQGRERKKSPAVAGGARARSEPFRFPFLKFRPPIAMRSRAGGRRAGQ